jgi:alpha-glucosidase
MALPGVVYVYQGDELGLWEVEDIAESELTDPTWRRSAHTDRGRDGCRVPLPWYGTNSSLGFSSVATARGPWLSQPARWRDMSVDVQLNDPTSMYYLYRNALVLRRNEMATTEGASMVWLPAPDGVLAFSGSYGFVCVVNIAADPIPISPRHTILLTSAEVSGVLPRDTAVWLHTIDSAGVVDGSAPWSLS